MKTENVKHYIEQWPIERLLPYGRNPRKNDGAVDRMIASIQEFGFKIPILARSDGQVVDGHLRLKAAQRIGLRELPVNRISCAARSTMQPGPMNPRNGSTLKKPGTIWSLVYVWDRIPESWRLPRRGPIPLLRELMRDSMTVVTRGSTYDKN